MYAVIETGGKQYRVEVGTELEVELLDVEPGQSITLERVLLVADGAEASVGTPLVDGAAVEAEVLRRDRGEKVIAFKYRPKARRRVKKGHRQELPVLRIADIRFGGKSAAEAEGKASARRRPSASASRRPPPRRPRRMRPSPRSSRSAPRRPAKADGAEGEDTTKKPPRRPSRRRKASRPRRQRPREAGGQARRRSPPRRRRPPRRPRPRRCAAKAAAAKPTRTEGAAHRRRTSNAMAHKKAGSSVKNGRDSAGQRLGVKAGDGQLVHSGTIIVRQRGMTFLGDGTGLGRDYTVFATVDGKVRFEHATQNKKRVRVIPVEPSGRRRGVTARNSGDHRRTGSERTASKEHS